MYTKPQKYITRRKWANFEAGTECLVSREHFNSPLKLTFDDGTVIETINCYAQGIEKRTNQPRIIDRAFNDIYEIEDKRWFDAVCGIIS